MISERYGVARTCSKCDRALQQDGRGGVPRVRQPRPPAAAALQRGPPRREAYNQVRGPEGGAAAGAHVRD